MCSENMQQIYRRTPIIELTLRDGCSLVNMLHIFRMPFLKNTSGRLPLQSIIWRDSLLNEGVGWKLISNVSYLGSDVMVAKPWSFKPATNVMCVMMLTSVLIAKKLGTFLQGVYECFGEVSIENLYKYWFGVVLQ